MRVNDVRAASGVHAQQQPRRYSELGSQPHARLFVLFADAADAFRAHAASLLSSTRYGAFIGVLTLYALYGDDIRLAATTKAADDYFFGMAACVLSIFCLDFALRCFAQDQYRFSWNFWLDLISTLATVPDVGWIWERLLGTEEAGSSDVVRTGAASASTARATRILRVVRLIRLLRVAKLWVRSSEPSKGGAQLPFRLRRRHRHKLRHRKSKGATQRRVPVEPSRVSKDLNERVTKVLMLFVLLLVLVLPLFDGQLIFTQNNAWQSDGLGTLHRTAQRSTATRESLRFELEQYMLASGRLVYLEICDEDSVCERTFPRSELYGWLRELRFQPLRGSGERDVGAPYSRSVNPLTKWRPSDLLDEIEDVRGKFRPAEIALQRSAGCLTDGGLRNATRSECLSLALFDETAATQLEALLSICKTTLVVVVVLLGVALLYSDAQTLVVGPIERMMFVVKALADNPLQSTFSSLDATAAPGASALSAPPSPIAEAGTPTLWTLCGDLQQRLRVCMRREQVRQNYETALLENTLKKIGALVQVGFGAAGAEIIRHNIGDESGGAELDPMVPGRLITAIYGFCDIRNFTDTTECLQQDVMLYVNCLGRIVHTATHANLGMANKNIGDAFLLSWKLCDGRLHPHDDFHPCGVSDYCDEAARRRRTSAMDGGPAAKDLKTVEVQTTDGGVRQVSPSEVANSALAAFALCIVDIEASNRNGALAGFTSRPEVVQRFGRGFKIRMGFGMHCGYSIEGAIGTVLKIDATYISQHVEMSDRLEAASKTLGSPLNLSHWFVDLLPPQTSRRCRPVDRVLAPGCPVPMTIYTLDVLCTNADAKECDALRTADEPPLSRKASSSSIARLPRPSNSQRKASAPRTKILLKRQSSASLSLSVTHNELLGEWRSRKIEHFMALVQKDLPRNFMATFGRGFDAYINGDWPKAASCMGTALSLKNDDGPAKRILAYIGSHKDGRAPTFWPSYRVDNSI